MMRPYRCKRHGRTDDYRVRRNGARVCRQCERDRQRLNPQSRRDRTRRWRERHPEQARECSRRSVAKWRKANPDKVKAASKADYEKFKERYFEHYYQRRARLAAAEINDFTEADWRELVDLYEGRCAYCNEKPDELEREHVIPLARQGHHTRSNIVPACGPCNRKKGSKIVVPPYMVPEYHGLAVAA